MLLYTLAILASNEHSFDFFKKYLENHKEVQNERQYNHEILNISFKGHLNTQIVDDLQNIFEKSLSRKNCKCKGQVMGDPLRDILSQHGADCNEYRYNNLYIYVRILDNFYETDSLGMLLYNQFLNFKEKNKEDYFYENEKFMIYFECIRSFEKFDIIYYENIIEIRDKNDKNFKHKHFHFFLNENMKEIQFFWLAEKLKDVMKEDTIKSHIAINIQNCHMDHKNISRFKKKDFNEKIIKNNAIFNCLNTIIFQTNIYFIDKSSEQKNYNSNMLIQECKYYYPENKIHEKDMDLIRAFMFVECFFLSKKSNISELSLKVSNYIKSMQKNSQDVLNKNLKETGSLPKVNFKNYAGSDSFQIEITAEIDCKSQNAVDFFRGIHELLNDNTNKLQITENKYIYHNFVYEETLFIPESDDFKDKVISWIKEEYTRNNSSAKHEIFALINNKSQSANKNIYEHIKDVKNFYYFEHELKKFENFLAERVDNPKKDCNQYLLKIVDSTEIYYIFIENEFLGHKANFINLYFKFRSELQNILKVYFTYEQGEELSKIFLVLKNLVKAPLKEEIRKIQIRFREILLIHLCQKIKKLKMRSNETIKSYFSMKKTIINGIKGHEYSLTGDLVILCKQIINEDPNKKENIHLTSEILDNIENIDNIDNMPKNIRLRFESRYNEQVKQFKSYNTMKIRVIKSSCNFDLANDKNHERIKKVREKLEGINERKRKKYNKC